MKTHILENDELRITVADAGAELVSVWDRETDSERLWTADPAVWNRHSPILFPFVGRVTDGRYRIGGREYSMKTQHGFARDMDFACIDETDTTVTHCLTATDRTRELYPYDFRLTVRHSLNRKEPRKLEVSWTVENTGDAEMYYAIGAHPGFLMPPGARKEDCLITFPGREELRFFGADAAGFAHPEREQSLKLDGGCARYQDSVPDTWIFEGQNIETTGIAGPDRKPWITMECSGFPMLAVWANKNGPFICLEPWFGRTDDAGFSGTLEEKKGMQRLESGERRDISYAVIFHR